VPDLTHAPSAAGNPLRFINKTNSFLAPGQHEPAHKPKPVPYYTIPPNATAVRDR